MTVALSPARLDRYAECPRCFWLQVNERADRPGGPFPSLPDGMDRTIKAHFDRYRRKGALPPELAGTVDAALETDRAFVERCRAWQADPTYVDRDLGVVLRGALDDLLRTPEGSLVVLDYKTRESPPPGETGTPDYYARQLSCYGLILRSNGHPTADHGMLLYYSPDVVTDDGAVRFHTELRRVPLDLEAVRGSVEGAVETLRGPLPDHQPGCAFCAWNAAEFG